MAVHRDEAHPVEKNKKMALVVFAVFAALVCTLIYLIAATFPTNPLISGILIVVLLLVVAFAIFMFDLHIFRESH